MFKCAETGKITAPREPMTKVVIVTRPVKYVNHNIDPESETGERIEVISHGYETVREISVSQEGLKVLEERKLSEMLTAHKI